MAAHKRRGLHRKRRETAGGSPGVLTVDPNAPQSRVQIMAYGPDALEEPAYGGPGSLTAIRRTHAVTWVNVDGLGNADVLNDLAQTFGIHALAMEDVVHVGQRTKVEDYEDHLFVILHMPRSGSNHGVEQVSLFLGRDHVVTFQETVGDCLDPIRARLRTGRTRIRTSGPDYLAYAIIDSIVDSFFPLVESLGERLLAMENRLLEDDKTLRVASLYDLKREMLGLRAVIRPQREAVNAILRSESALVQDSTDVFLRDAYDHAFHLAELAENYHELSASLIELYRSNAANRLNEVMKVLTIIATIFIPITFIAGIYGMNFDPEASGWNMPELHWKWGYPAALLVMAAVAVVMLLYFKRKGWLGGGDGDEGGS